MKYLWGIFVAVIFVGFSFSSVHAAEPLQATVSSITNNGVITMAPGERKEISVQFTNAGTSTWSNDGAGYISLYTHGPKYRKSVFDSGTWLWGDRLKRIREVKVAPGSTGSMVFELKAPAQAGYYEEVFHLASESVAWVPGGQLTLKITVKEGASTDEKVEETSDASGLSAEISVKSANHVKTLAGKPISFTVAFKNTGTTTWTSYGMYAPDVSIASNASDFTHPSWSGSELAYVSNTPVKPGENAIVSFSFNAPATNGTHSATFELKANGVQVPGGSVEIPVEVTNGAQQTVTPPVAEDIEEEPAIDYIPEPLVRVGVLIVDEETDWEVVITSLESDFELRDIDGNLIAELAKGQEVAAHYVDGKYYFNRGQGVESSPSGLRFIPKTENAVMRVVNWDRRITRGASHADNEFRNILELRYNDYKDRMWLINEVGMENYLRGLAETSDYHPLEMNKAQVTAARTYAYYYVLHAGKHSKEFFHLNATPSDQLYQGYGREKRAPLIVQAINETAGAVVTYNDQVAITPYYARSNGSTKDWSKVWYGDQAHVKGVAVPCDAGKTQWGHGLGMPQSGALCMADDGKNWEEILTYFYTGVEIEKKWK